MLRSVASADSSVSFDKVFVGISNVTDFGLGVDRDDSGSNSSPDVRSNSTSDSSSSSSDSSDKTALALPCVWAAFFFSFFNQIFKFFFLSYC